MSLRRKSPDRQQGAAPAPSPRTGGAHSAPYRTLTIGESVYRASPFSGALEQQWAAAWRRRRGIR